MTTCRDTLSWHVVITRCRDNVSCMTLCHDNVSCMTHSHDKVSWQRVMTTCLDTLSRQRVTAHCDDTLSWHVVMMLSNTTNSSKTTNIVITDIHLGHVRSALTFSVFNPSCWYDYYQHFWFNRPSFWSQSRLEQFLKTSKVQVLDLYIWYFIYTTLFAIAGREKIRKWKIKQATKVITKNQLLYRPISQMLNQQHQSIEGLAKLFNAVQ